MRVAPVSAAEVAEMTDEEFDAAYAARQARKQAAA